MPAFDAVGMDAVGATIAGSATTPGSAFGADLRSAGTASWGTAGATSSGSASGASLAGISTAAWGAVTISAAGAPGANLRSAPTTSWGYASNGTIIPVTFPAATVSAARRVVFPGGTKVVTFPGGTKRVIF